MTNWTYGKDASGGDRRIYADGEDVGWMHGVDAVRIVEEVATIRAENERLRGLLHSEVICEMHYCELHEMAYQRGIGAPARCPYCEVDRLRAVVNEARKLANGAAPQWAPELRAAIAATRSEGDPT